MSVEWQYLHSMIPQASVVLVADLIPEFFSKWMTQLVTDRNVYSGSHLTLPAGRREILVKKIKGLNCSQFIIFTTGTISSPKYNAPLGWRVISLRNLHSHSSFFCIPLPLCLPRLLSIWAFDRRLFQLQLYWLAYSLEISSVHNTPLGSHSQEPAAEYQAPPGPYNGSEMQCPDLKTTL